MIFVDTNYFLRFFLKDIEDQYLEAKRLFLEASKGKIKLISSTIVFFEVYWVLVSYYGRGKVDLCRSLKKLLEFTFIVFEERTILEECLEIFEKINLSLEDCYNLVYASNVEVETLATFDQKLSNKFKELKNS